MLALTLREQIYNFVCEFRLVEERQIYKIFQDQGKNNVAFEIASLKRTGRIFELQDGRLSAIRRLPMDQWNYENIIRAINVLCELPSSRIRWYALEDYPQEIVFVTDEDIIYDVAVFDEYNWVTKYGLIPRWRKRTIPAGEKDPINHIAVIPNRDLIPKIESLGFSMYAIIDSKGNVLEMVTYAD